MDNNDNNTRLISAKVVFRDESNNIVTSVNSDFFSQWASGELRRDFEVTLSNPDEVAKSLRSGSKALVAGDIYKAFLEIDQYLSLANKLLSFWKDPSLETVRSSITVQNTDSSSILFASEVEKIDVSPTKIKYYTTYYWFNASVIHSLEWYHRDPNIVVREIILELLLKWTLRDNRTILSLLNQVEKINKPLLFKKLTPGTFQKLRTQVEKWSIPASYFLATAEVLSELDNTSADWSRFRSLSMNQLDIKRGDLLHDEKIMNTPMFCLGSPHDIIYPVSKGMFDMYMCGMPHILGVRAVKGELEEKPVDRDILGVKQYGWLWVIYMGTVILSPYAVAMAKLGESSD